jgi:hypothetical protein
MAQPRRKLRGLDNLGRLIDDRIRAHGGGMQATPAAPLPAGIPLSGGSSSPAADLTAAHRQVFPAAAGLAPTGSAAVVWLADKLPGAAAMPSALGGTDPAARVLADIALPATLGGAPGAGPGGLSAELCIYWTAAVYGGDLGQAQVALLAPALRFGTFATARVGVRLRVGDPARFGHIGLYLLDAAGTMAGSSTTVTPATSAADYWSAELDTSGLGDTLLIVLVAQGTATLAAAGLTELYCSHLILEQWA